jgi:hypothetical protein
VIALASARCGDRAARLTEAAEAAAAAGFTRVFASVPPRDAVAARRAIAAAGIALDGVSTGAPPRLAEVGAAIDEAARAAAELRVRLVVLDTARLAAGSAPEADLVALARALFDAFARWSGATISLRAGGGSLRAGGGALLDLSATEALLSDLASKPVALFLDPARVKDPLAWAERAGGRTAGIALSEGIDVDWGTLRGSIPSRAVRVLEVDPAVTPVEVVAARRRFEESLKF